MASEFLGIRNAARIRFKDKWCLIYVELLYLRTLLVELLFLLVLKIGGAQ